MAGVCRIQIHRKVTHWRQQAKDEKAKIIQQMQSGRCTCLDNVLPIERASDMRQCDIVSRTDREEFEKATALLPDHLRQQLENDHNWTYDHAVVGASPHEDSENSGIWLQVCRFAESLRALLT